MEPLNTPDIEELQSMALAAIDQITYCAEKLAMCMGVSTLHDEAENALANIICRVDDLPLALENIRDDATGMKMLRKDHLLEAEQEKQELYDFVKRDLTPLVEQQSGVESERYQKLRKLYFVLRNRTVQNWGPHELTMDVAMRLP